jgi:hypothetical protein
MFLQSLVLIGLPHPQNPRVRDFRKRNDIGGGQGIAMIVESLHR